MNLKSSLFLVLVVLSICAGCSANIETEENDFVFYNAGKSVGYGSTVDEVEKIFGTSFKKTFLGNDYGAATVLFRDDKAVCVIIEPEGIINILNNLWITSKGIGIGSKEEDLQKAYELTDADKYEDVAYDILLKADGDNLVKCSADEAEYCLSFYLIGKSINKIALGDIVAVRTLE